MSVFGNSFSKSADAVGRVGLVGAVGGPIACRIVELRAGIRLPGSLQGVVLLVGVLQAHRDRRRAARSRTRPSRCCCRCSAARTTVAGRSSLPAEIEPLNDSDDIGVTIRMRREPVASAGPRCRTAAARPVRRCRRASARRGRIRRAWHARRRARSVSQLMPVASTDTRSVSSVVVSKVRNVWSIYFAGIARREMPTYGIGVSDASASNVRRVNE